MSDLQRQIIDALASDADKVVITRPLAPVNTHLALSVPTQPCPQTFSNPTSSPGYEGNVESSASPLATALPPPSAGTPKSEEIEQRQFPADGKSEAPPTNAGMGEQAPIPRLAYVDEMKAATASNNAISGYIESQNRLNRHQAQVYQDQQINSARDQLRMTVPIPLPEVIEINATPPIEALPGEAREFVRSVAALLGVAPEMVLVALLGTIFIAARGNFMIRVTPEYHEALTAYLVGAAASGQRKSAVIGYFRAFIDEVESLLLSERASEGRDMAHELRQSTLKSMKAELAADYTELAKKVGLNLADVTLKQRIVDIERTEKSLRVARAAPKFLTDLSTPEKLAEDMERQGEAIGILSAEGGTWKRQNARSDDLLLKAFTGEPFELRTKTLGLAFLQRPIMAICTLVQPNVLEALYSNEELAGHGLTPRILPVYIPSQKGGGCGTTPEVPADLEKKFKALIRGLLTLERPNGGEQERTFYTLDIAPEGQARIRLYRDQIRTQMFSGQFDGFQAFGDKIVGHAIRVGGAIHLLKHADPQNHPIDTDSIESGIIIAEFFRQHAKAAFTPELRNGLVFARKVLRYIEDLPVMTFSPREAQQHVHGAKAHHIRAGIAVLERHGFVRRLAFGRKEVCVVHPNAHQWA